ncbi:MAG: SulP family inorganic anion transporter [Chlamydiales bacterium]
MQNAKQSYWIEFVPKSWHFLKNYSLNLFKSDLIAGITVGVVALPLAMAFSIAAGLSPESGLYTAIIAGFLISLLGGSRLQIGGPTGAFVVIIYDIVQRHGYDGLVITTLIAGMLLLIAAFSRLGSLIKYIPYPVVIGFTTGIAVLIFSSQIKDFFGLRIEKMPADFFSIWMAIISALPTWHLPTFALAFGTLALILLIRRFAPILPWGITSVVLATAAAWAFKLPIETIAARFGEIPQTFPLPSLPHLSIPWQEWHALIPDAITVAFLAGIESLLSALVADGMAGTRHKSNCELMAQGVANISSVLCGGIPATGAIARTATNIKSGAKTPMAGMIHSATILLIILTLAPIVSLIPLASLSAVLIMVAWNMSEADRFRHLFKAPLGDVAILLTTFFLTVFIDLTVAIEMGMILALFLFVKRMSDRTVIISLTALERDYAEKSEEYDLGMLDRAQLPPGFEVYEITGPFFFGIADSLKNVLSNLEYPPKVFILHMRKVSMIDASGMYSLMEFYEKCKIDQTILLLAGVNDKLLIKLKKFGILDLIGKEHIFSNLKSALKFDI